MMPPNRRGRRDAAIANRNDRATTVASAPMLNVRIDRLSLPAGAGNPGVYAETLGRELTRLLRAPPDARQNAQPDHPRDGSPRDAALRIADTLRADRRIRDV
jgi:hypothetical protein